MPAELPCVCAASRRVARLLTQLYDGHLRGSGLEAPQFALLMALEAEEPLSQIDIGRSFALDKTTVSRNLKLLERDGLIQSMTPDDKRKRLFRLTPVGRKQLAVAKPKWQKAQEHLRSGMTARQWNDIFRVFRTVAAVAKSPLRNP
jgi:DNA-binding MarR family transcriptional regulator